MNTHRRHARPAAMPPPRADTMSQRSSSRIPHRPARAPERLDVQKSHERPLFQDAVLAHVDSGYNLARWLLRDEHLASDALQDALLKSWRSFDSFRGGDPKSWFLAIVRTSTIDIARRRHRDRPQSLDNAPEPAPPDTRPLSSILRREHANIVHEVVWSLPEHHREILVLKEIEGMTYAQIATTLAVPIGTVMSRISRARDAAQAALQARLGKEHTDGL